jgi:protein translocase SEC61 complex gamma subunit
VRIEGWQASKHISLTERSNSRMGVRDFLRSAAAIFRLAHKSDRDEFMLYLKLVALGIALVGTIGFLIKLVGNAFFG